MAWVSRGVDSSVGADRCDATGHHGESESRHADQYGPGNGLGGRREGVYAGAGSCQQSTHRGQYTCNRSSLYNVLLVPGRPKRSIIYGVLDWQQCTPR